MTDPEILLKQLSQLYGGLNSYRDLLASENYEEAETLRSELTGLWGEAQEDVIELGVPLYWSASGITFPIFEGALSTFNDLTASVYFQSIDHARASLEMAKGKLRRRIRQHETKVGAPPPDPSSRGKNVFVVHGHNQGLREAVARLIERLGLDPVILMEQPDQGQTVIEKFEKHSDVTYAVIILTPDDMGYPAQNPELAKPRARQNVILELGFFIASLRRENVCILHVGDLELPSDIHGLLYIPADSDVWKLKLAQELKAAGFEIDLNKIAD